MVERSGVFLDKTISMVQEFNPVGIGKKEEERRINIKLIINEYCSIEINL
jgi:hypothetical protein